ncbi:uncharacterized protein CLUP02_14970 [Colletotrichum lupini]|uniref:Uncharacterized protein n=1 Tax=Colletotrichum lupini TaxID=145971 RepID=A0A9Q8WN38_9PEZI|nr:uncharacterized protein CLUP02_14970 [Colletotrichum lupini]UQC89439.1 hypothetical protein CLUP02_14970 [Colletotrichum lupini]
MFGTSTWHRLNKLENLRGFEVRGVEGDKKHLARTAGVNISSGLSSKFSRVDTGFPSIYLIRQVAAIGARAEQRKERAGALLLDLSNSLGITGGSTKDRPAGSSTRFSLFPLPHAWHLNHFHWAYTLVDPGGPRSCVICEAAGLSSNGVIREGLRFIRRRIRHQAIGDLEENDEAIGNWKFEQGAACPSKLRHGMAYAITRSTYGYRYSKRQSAKFNGPCSWPQPFLNQGPPCTKCPSIRQRESIRQGSASEKGILVPQYSRKISSSNQIAVTLTAPWFALAMEHLMLSGGSRIFCYCLSAYGPKEKSPTTIQITGTRTFFALLYLPYMFLGPGKFGPSRKVTQDSAAPGNASPHPAAPDAVDERAPLIPTRVPANISISWFVDRTSLRCTIGQLILDEVTASLQKQTGNSLIRKFATCNANADFFFVDFPQVAFSHLIPKLQFEQKRRITSTRRLGVCGIYPSSIGWLAMYGLILNYIPTASVTAPHHTEECNPSRSRVTNVHRRGGTWKLHAARTSAMLRLRCACERKYNRSQTFCHRLTGFPSRLGNSIARQAIDLTPSILPNAFQRDDFPALTVCCYTSDAQNSDHENLIHALGTFVAARIPAWLQPHPGSWRFSPQYEAAPSPWKLEAIKPQVTICASIPHDEATSYRLYEVAREVLSCDPLNYANAVFVSSPTKYLSSVAGASAACLDDRTTLVSLTLSVNGLAVHRPFGTDISREHTWEKEASSLIFSDQFEGPDTQTWGHSPNNQTVRLAIEHLARPELLPAIPRASLLSAGQGSGTTEGLSDKIFIRASLTPEYFRQRYVDAVPFAGACPAFMPLLGAQPAGLLFEPGTSARDAGHSPMKFFKVRLGDNGPLFDRQLIQTSQQQLGNGPQTWPIEIGNAVEVGILGFRKLLPSVVLGSTLQKLPGVGQHLTSGLRRTTGLVVLEYLQPSRQVQANGLPDFIGNVSHTLNSRKKGVLGFSVGVLIVSRHLMRSPLYP